jgi:hypothetical protein
MGIQLEITPARVIEIATAAIAAEEKRWTDQRTKVISHIADHLQASNGFLYWRLLTGNKYDRGGALVEAERQFDDMSFDGLHWGKHFEYSYRMGKFKEWLNAASACETQTMIFTGSDAHSIASWAKKD